MKITGPIKITIEGAQASGKSQLTEAIMKMLDAENILYVGFSEGAEFKDYGQLISIIEKQT